MDVSTEPVTKDYLDMKLKGELQQLKADLLEQLILNQRSTIGLICGLYATNFAMLLGIIGILYAVLKV